MSNTSTNEHYQLIKGWGQLLELQSWSLFCTFTTHFNLSADAARRKVVELFRILKEELRLNPTMFWVAEPFYIRTDYHIHALIKLNPTIIPPEKIIKDAWLKICKPGGYKKNNRVHTVNYDPKKGARYYVAKHLTKPDVDYDFL